MRAAVAFAALVAACGGGGRGPCLLAIRKVGPADRLIQICARGGDAHEVVPALAGDVRGAIVIERGRAVLVAIDPTDGGGRALYRVDAGGTATGLWQTRRPFTLEAASADGKTVVLDHATLLELGATVAQHDLGAPRSPQWRDTAISDDGERIAISLGPDCPAGASMVDCRLEVWGYDRRDAARGWRPIARGTTSMYNPRFVPGGGDELVYHAIEPDAAPRCVGPWACRVEDVVRVRWDGGGARVVKAGAWTPRFAADGRTLAVAAPKTKELLAGDPDGELARVAADASFAGPVSADGAWLAYDNDVDRAQVEIVRRDGSDHRDLGEARMIGWIAAPLPEGAPAPPPPTADERARSALAAAIARARTHRRAGEPIAIVGASRDDVARASGTTPATPVTEDDAITLLARPERALIVLPRSGLCAFDPRAQARGARYAVVDDPAAEAYLVVTNRPDEHEPDVNPLVDERRGGRPQHEVRATFANGVELLGLDYPDHVRRGDAFPVALYFHVRDHVGYGWRIFMHFDGGATRFSGDHDAGVCGATWWPIGADVVDHVTVHAGGISTPPGTYTIWAGFYRGGAGAYENAAVTEGDHDRGDRVRVGQIRVDPDP